MTATVTVTDNTVKVDELILKLDSLVSAYDEVLSMAKQQLEQFAISEDDWSRIYERLTRRIDYHDLGAVLRRNLLVGMEWMDLNPGEDSSDPTVVFAKTLITQIRRQLEAAIRDYIVSDTIRDQFNELRAELRHELRTVAVDAAKDAVQAVERDRVRTADGLNELVREMLDRTFGNELKTMVRDAASQINS